MQARKRSRQSLGSNNGDDSNSRRRLEEDDDDDNQYAESSRFARQNGMGNGGVYGANQFYTNDSDASYTPHLLPMFQNNNVFQQPNEDNHLEDASVLLSMAYPTGVPAKDRNGQPTETNGHDSVADWETGQQTINMMMEQARVDTTGGPSVNTNTSTETSQDTSPVLTEPLNFLGAMNWLETQGQKDGGSGSQGWVRVSFHRCVCLPITAQHLESFASTIITIPLFLLHLPIRLWPISASRRVPDRWIQRWSSKVAARHAGNVRYTTDKDESQSRETIVTYPS